MPRWLSSLAGATYAPRQSWNVKTRSEIPPPPPHVPARAPPPPVSTVRQISGEVPNTVLKVNPKSPSPATCLPLLIKPAEYSCGGAAPKAAATLICCTCQVSMKLVLWSMVSVNKTEEEKSVPWLEVPFVFFSEAAIVQGVGCRQVLQNKLWRFEMFSRRERVVIISWPVGTSP